MNINPDTGCKVSSSLGTFLFTDWNYFLDYLVDVKSPIRLDEYNLKVFHKSTVIYVELFKDDENEGGFAYEYIRDNYLEIENLKLLPPEILRQQFPDLYNQQYASEFDSTQSPKIPMIQTQPNVIHADFVRLPPIS